MSTPLSSSPSADDTLVQRTTNGKRKQEPPAPDAPTKKRAKMSSPSTGFTRHPTFWAEDGSVFLQFGETRMKLHRSRLAAHSEWFQELFDKKGVVLSGEVEWSIPWANVDGVDLFELDGTGIALEDFEAVLTTLESGVKYCYAKPPFAFVVSLVHAASFFQFTEILDFGTAFLEENFTDDLGELTENALPVAHATEAVLLGRNWKLPQLLKRAFYELARAPANEISNRAESINELDTDDLVLIIDLQRHLTAAWFKVLSFPKSSCTSSPACEKAGKTNILPLTHGIVKKYHFDPVWGLSELKKLDWKDRGYCATCSVVRVKWLDEQQVKLWDDVSNWLELDTDTDSDTSD
ncbi:hypothetical protein BDN72DRAFT_801038 [Pluteus cervinus]|uniref:Uncharacterized protein n=1 Tax=Pluteus cervinus TaxID=181527 RepID=A0ACD3AI34_9AGAR|nr:hypothetical protein BDN72DRAFT_801038 [Pluteus cervinus]